MVRARPLSSFMNVSVIVFQIYSRNRGLLINYSHIIDEKKILAGSLLLIQQNY